MGGSLQYLEILQFPKQFLRYLLNICFPAIRFSAVSVHTTGTTVRYYILTKPVEPPEGKYDPTQTSSLAA